MRLVEVPLHELSSELRQPSLFFPHISSANSHHNTNLRSKKLDKTPQIPTSSWIHLPAIDIDLELHVELKALVTGLFQMAARNLGFKPVISSEIWFEHVESVFVTLAGFSLDCKLERWQTFSWLLQHSHLKNIFKFSNCNRPSDNFGTHLQRSHW